MQIGNIILENRIFLGSSRYPSLQIFESSVKASKAQVVTVSLRRAHPQQEKDHEFWQSLRRLGVHLLPNTAGCRTAAEAIALAQMARELFDTPWIKLEVIGDEETLQPHPVELVRAAKELIRQGFVVFPYMTEDLVIAEQLLQAGCEILMPWGSPIGSGRGLMNPYLLKTLRSRFPEVPMVIDAGIGRPSDAVCAMELGFDAILLNTAVAEAHDPEQMARAFALAVTSGRMGYESGLMPRRDMAQPSTPVLGQPFWHQQGGSL